MNRDELRRRLVERQMDICVICGHGMYGDSAVHEAIIKRGDLPDDKRVFDEHNCVAIHNGMCHQNTKTVDRKAIGYLLDYYGMEAIFGWICSLDMKVYPGRAMEIMNAQEQKAS